MCSLFSCATMTTSLGSRVRSTVQWSSLGALSVRQPWVLSGRRRHRHVTWSDSGAGFWGLDRLVTRWLRPFAAAVAASALVSWSLGRGCSLRSPLFRCSSGPQSSHQAWPASAWQQRPIPIVSANYSTTGPCEATSAYLTASSVLNSERHYHSREVDCFISRRSLTLPVRLSDRVLHFGGRGRSGVCSSFGRLVWEIS